ncbi:MAG: DUF547 domain-containing protein [Planctomycetia bacterium]|nr:DUF547 domain-containing protein [Planctomycetia bacterium]
MLAVIGVVYATSGDFVRERQVVLGKSWTATELVSIETIDHRDWDRLLRRYVDAEGNVGYAGWKETPGDVEALDTYLSTLSLANPALDAGRDSRLAFWINAYNALTIRGILREYPTASVSQHTAQSPGFSFWRDLRLHVGDRDYSLGQIEHELLRPLREPRIHFAIVCGSRGCPRLLNRAYHTSDLEQQLRDNARNFFADPQKLEFDSSTGQLRLSPILKWYADDFGESQAEMLNSIIPYLPDHVNGQLPDRRRIRADFLDYDRSLNDQAPATSDIPIPPNAEQADGDQTPPESER